jgi:hypothetical protein
MAQSAAARGMLRGLCIAATLAGSAGAASGSMTSERSAASRLGVPQDHGDLSAFVVQAPTGEALFAFDFTPDSHGDGVAPGCVDPERRGYLGVRRRDGRLVSLGRVSAIQAPPVMTRRMTAVIVGRRHCGTESAESNHIEPLQRLRLLRGPVGLRLSRSAPLTERAEADSTTAAASDGELAVAWLEPAHRREPIDRLHVAVGRIAGDAWPRHVLAEGRAVSDVRLAWTSDAELLVVYAAGTRIMIQTWRRGRGFERPRTLGTIRVGTLALSVAVGPSGRALVAWGAQAHGIEPDSPFVVRAAIRTASHRRFSSARLLDPGGPAKREPVTYVSTSIGSDGIASVGWQSDRPDDPVKAATIDRRGGFQPPQSISPASRHHNVLVDQPDGSTLLQWDSDRGLQQSVRPRNSLVFSAPSPSASPADEVEGAVLIDSRTGG